MVIAELQRIDGVGESTALMMYERLHIRSITDLVEAAEREQVRVLEGQGKATESFILKAAREYLASAEENGSFQGAAMENGSTAEQTTSSSTGFSRGNAKLKCLTNEIPFDLTIAIPENEPAVLVRADCHPLPWLPSHPPFLDALKSSFAEFHGKNHRNWQDPTAIRFMLEITLDQILAGFLDGAVSRIGTVRLELQTHQPSLERMRTPDWLHVVAFEKYLVDNCKKLSPEAIAPKKQTVFYTLLPEQASTQIELNGDQPFLLSQIFLICDGERQWGEKVHRVITKEDSILTVPQPPLSFFEAIANAKDAKLGVKLADGKTVTLNNIDVKAATFTKGPAMLFVDLGSWNSKLLRLDLPISSKDHEASARQILSEGNESQIRSEMRRTPEFVEMYGLPKESKSALVEAGEAQVAEWFVTATAALARSRAKGEQPIWSISWSFPELENVDVDRIQRLVAEKAKKYVLGDVQVFAEHDAIRNRFSSVLPRLASAAVAAKDERERAERKKKQAQKQHEALKAEYESKRKEYQNRGWFKRLFGLGTKPTHPGSPRKVFVPDLEDWHREFLELDIDPLFRDYIIVDAGGLSLDVHIRVGQHKLERSFEAGGAQITEGFLEALPGLENMRGAEEHKLTASHLPPDKHDGKLLADLSREVYEPALKNIAEWLANHLEKNGRRGIPVIVTGGAAQNRNFPNLLGEQLEHVGLAHRITTGPELIDYVEAQTSLMNESQYRRFSALTRHGKPSMYGPSVYFDIIGGHVESRLQED